MPKEKLREEMVKILKNPKYADALSSLPCPLDSCQKLKELGYFVSFITVIIVIISNFV